MGAGRCLFDGHGEDLASHGGSDWAGLGVLPATGPPASRGRRDQHLGEGMQGSWFGKRGHIFNAPAHCISKSQVAWVDTAKQCQAPMVMTPVHPKRGLRTTRKTTWTSANVAIAHLRIHNLSFFCGVT